MEGVDAGPAVPSFGLEERRNRRPLWLRRATRWFYVGRRRLGRLLRLLADERVSLLAGAAFVACAAFSPRYERRVAARLPAEDRFTLQWAPAVGPAALWALALLACRLRGQPVWAWLTRRLRPLRLLAMGLLASGAGLAHLLAAERSAAPAQAMLSPYALGLPLARILALFVVAETTYTGQGAVLVLVLAGATIEVVGDFLDAGNAMDALHVSWDVVFYSGSVLRVGADAMAARMIRRTPGLRRWQAALCVLFAGAWVRLVFACAVTLPVHLLPRLGVADGARFDATQREALAEALPGAAGDLSAFCLLQAGAEAARTAGFAGPLGLTWVYVLGALAGPLQVGGGGGRLDWLAALALGGAAALYWLVSVRDRVPRPTQRLSKAVRLAQLTERDLSALWALFRKHRDQHGLVSLTAFHKMIHEKRTDFGDSIFSLIDVTDHEFLTFAEFTQTIVTYCSFETPEVLKLCFFVLDVNRNGFIEREELGALVRLLHGVSEIKGNLENALRLFDRNKDGQISFDEFSKINSSYPMVFYPAFRLQTAMIQHTLGEHWWEAKKLSLQLQREDARASQERRWRQVERLVERVRQARIRHAGRSGVWLLVALLRGTATVESVEEQFPRSPPLSGCSPEELAMLEREALQVLAELEPDMVTLGCFCICVWRTVRCRVLAHALYALFLLLVLALCALAVLGRHREALGPALRGAVP